jgi:GNAT superfamily N-acetyltransferase
VVDIWKLGPEDWELLSRAVATFTEGDAAAPDLFLSDPRTHAFVALEREEVVGWCYGAELFRPEGRWMMLLYGIDVVERARRRRVGRELLDRFVELARSKGHDRMWLFTDAGRVAARALYEDAGDDPGEKLGTWWVFG